MKVIVIGGGASGLIAAIKASDNNDVTILEKNSICGKKLLMTGNGRCNYFNRDQNIKHYHSEFFCLEKFIDSNYNQKILDFFASIGIIPEIRNGYYYPMSNQAISIKNSLVLELQIRNVKIKNNVVVKSIKKTNNVFIIKTDNEIFEADVVILATGGCSYPKTGSDGNGYKLAKSLGHTIIKPLPGLVQLITKDEIKNASGVRTKVKVSLIEENNFIREELGELQITDYGISGICIMQLSSYISKGLSKNYKEELAINFLPEINNALEMLEMRNRNLRNRTISQLLEGILNYKLINVLLKKTNINLNAKWDEITNEKKTNLINNLTNYKILVEDTKGFDNAQVTVGGIPLNEIDKNFESKIITNLYLVGEILDVNGDCGGYNLSWAWISGYKAGESIHD